MDFKAFLSKLPLITATEDRTNEMGPVNGRYILFSKTEA
jgi:hypothetical protein